MYGLGLLGSPFAATGLANGGVGGGDNWRGFFWVLFGVGVCNFLCVGVAFWEGGVVFRKKDMRERGEGEIISAPWEEMKSMLKLKNVWVISLFFFFYLGVATTAGGKFNPSFLPLPLIRILMLSGWIVEFLVHTRHGSLEEMGYVPSGFYGGLCISRLVLAEPTHRWGERRMLMIYSGLCLASQLVFWLVPNLVSSITVFSLLGFFLGPFFAAVSIFERESTK